MNLSQRERYIAMGVIAAILLMGLNHFVIDPYFTERSALVKSEEDLHKQLNEANQLFTRQRRLRKIWTEMQAGGLKVDPSLAESQTYQALLEWARSANVGLPVVKSDRQSQEGNFQVISFSVTATGSMPQVSRLLWALETASIPVRVNEVQVTPVKEGTDALQVRISVSSLCQPPEEAVKTSVTEAGGKS